MEWLVLGIAVLLAALLGFSVGGYFCWRAIQNLLQPQFRDLHLNMASDRELALRTLRRELANYLVRLDPDRFLRLYREARGADVAIGKADKASQEG